MPKIKGGFYLKARIIQEKKISKAPPHIREVWDYLLREANHKDKSYGGNFVKRGQLFRSYQDIREGLSWMVGWRKMMYNENHMKKSMKFLRECQCITTKKELGGVLITILNYDHYQNPKNYERTKEGTTERTIAEPLLNQPPPDNNKNEKNEKNVKKKETITKDNMDFNLFWQAYPRKVGKQDCIKIWLNPKKKKIRPPIVKILHALGEQKISDDWTKEDGRFIPNPATWLNQGRWDDELRKSHPLKGKVSEKGIRNIEVLKKWRDQTNERRD